MFGRYFNPFLHFFNRYLQHIDSDKIPIDTDKAAIATWYPNILVTVCGSVDWAKTYTQEKRKRENKAH